MTPKEIVEELDRDIVGQDEAKKAVAIALRNRWRRMQLDEDLRAEVTPKNILMIGPTGVGKTEIARRLAKLAKAPFIKVEATKFTEVGYVGRDVESIIRDLVDIAIKMFREEEITLVNEAASKRAKDKILDVLLPLRKENEKDTDTEKQDIDTQSESEARKLLRTKLDNGDLDDKEIDIEIQSRQPGVEIMSPPGMEEMTSQLQNMFSSLGSRKKTKRKHKVKDAIRLLQSEEAEKLVDEDKLKQKAVEAVEQNGIVFIDEIDKVAKRSDSSNSDVSREGVQRDLLPLIEGCTVSTKYGMVKTDHILFISSGSFHLAKPSDLIPELQGRMPIRVELKELKIDDFVRILIEPKSSLVRQYKALLKTESIDLQFTDDGIKRIAEVSWQVNDSTENIGARRLHTVLEKLLEEISFNAGSEDSKATEFVIDNEYVDKNLKDLSLNEDLSRYIL